MASANGRESANIPRRIGASKPDLVCISHLRWDFVHQRPQHLLGRAARDRRVWYVEEPVWGRGPSKLEVRTTEEGVRIATPHMVDGTPASWVDEAVRSLLDDLLERESVSDFVLWYYTPMGLGFTAHLEPLVTVYDVMDELSLFRGAPQALLERERELFERADVIFTGGASLFEAKRERHPNVHLFPSSIDVAHFDVARGTVLEPPDQRSIAHPRLGFFGVIDERMDLELLAAVADARPEWQIVLVGPVVKIDVSELPLRPNIHYLGGKRYDELPNYIAGWSVALMPWALNDATRFISPTKTPEYLAAGKNVVSTAVRDVAHPYGSEGLVRIAESLEEFMEEVESALRESPEQRMSWLRRVDERLAQTSWDRTWAAMDAAIEEQLALRGRSAATPELAAEAAD